MIRVGITGGIGSGKSTVCRIFKSLGIPVSDADELAKRLITNDEILKQSIVKYFGKESYTENGEYNRSYISGIVFNNPEKLELLNSLVHPVVIQRSNEWAEKHSASPYIIKEAALMFESGSYLHNDINIVVESPLNIRLRRIVERDQSTEEAAMKRISSQMSDEERRSKADKIIYNDEGHSLISQVYELHKELISR